MIFLIEYVHKLYTRSYDFYDMNNERKMNNNINGKECIVAFVDLLGFKDFVEKNSTMDILSIFRIIQKEKDHIKKDQIIDFENEEFENEYNQLSKKTYFRIMSDSIIIAIDVLSEQALMFVIKWIAIIQSTLLGGDKKILSRGGIACGEFYGDEEIMFGKGMVRAYNLEKIAKTPRVIIEKDLIEKIWGSDYEDIYNEPTSIIKKDEDEKLYVDYLEQIDWEKNSERLSDYVNEGIDLCDSISEKYVWLKNKMIHQIDMINMMIENNENGLM